jgi:hypothetical protein
LVIGTLLCTFRKAEFLIFIPQVMEHKLYLKKKEGNLLDILYFVGEEFVA